MMARSCKNAQRYLRVGWPGRGSARPIHAPHGLVSADVDGRQLAHWSLAGPHRRSSVALQGFDMIEAFGYSILKVLRAHIGAQANESPFARDDFRGRQRRSGDERRPGYVADRRNV